MSLEQAKKILSQGLTGLAPRQVAVQPEDIPGYKVMGKPIGDKKLSSLAPSKVTKENDISTFSLPDGREFRMDAYGKPVIQARTLTGKDTAKKRGGSFSETKKEVDHKVPIGLGGTDASGNLQLLKSKKTISQTVFDFISGNKSEIGDYKPENRQEGKMIVEQEAIRKYRNGDITLFEAMGAVQNFDNQKVVDDFLHRKNNEKQDEFLNFLLNPKKTIKEKSSLWIKEKIHESRKKGVLNEVVGFIGGKHFVDTKDGEHMILGVGEGMDEQEKLKAQEAISNKKGIIEPVFSALPAKEKTLVTATLPIRWTAGSLARLSIGLGLEVTHSDLTFTPQTKLQEYLMGREDFERISTSDDAYGSVFKLVEQKLEYKGVSADKSQKTALATTLLLGAVLENPFFSFGKQATKEVIEKTLKDSLEREVGQNLSNEAITEIGELATRVSKLQDFEDKVRVVQEYIQNFKENPKIDLEQQEFDALPEKTKMKLFMGEEDLNSSKSPIDQLADDLISGKEKVRVPLSGKEDIKAMIGSGHYTSMFRKNNNLSTLDDMATSVGADQNELLEAISKASKEKARPSVKAKSSPLTQTLPKKAALLETQAGESLSKQAPVASGEVSSYTDSIARVVTNVKDKINVIDYSRTPDRVLKKIGFEAEEKLLRKGYDGYVKELPKNIEKITEWSKRVSPDANKKIFQWLDGKVVNLDKEEQIVASEIKEWLSGWADRLDLPKDNRVSSYITHLFDEELLAKEFDEDLAKIIANKLPGEVYDPFLEKRLGAKGYIQDTWAALDAYVKRGTRKVHMDEALTAIKTKAGSSLETSKIEASQFEYLKKYVDNVNLRPAKIDTLIDNAIKSVIDYKAGQRPVTRIAKFLRQMTFRGMLGLNPVSALRNLSQGVNTYAVLGEKYTVIGYAKLFQKDAMKELEEVGVLASNFIQDRVLSATKKKMEKVDKVLFSFFDAAEKINRGAAYFGAKSKALNEGKPLEEAIDYAKEIVRKTQFSFGSIDTPVALQGDIIKTLTQFQTYTIKQIEFLTEMAMDKNFVGLLRYAVGGMMFVYTAGQAFGMKPEDLIPSFRFETPPSLKLPKELTKAALDSPDKFGKERDLKEKASDIGKSLIGLIPAGAQIKKTYEGAKAIQEGGSYDKAGNLQFEQGQSKLEKAQTLIAGKYAGKSAKSYFAKSETKAKSVKEMTPIYKRVQTLVGEGKDEEAQAIVDDLSEEEYATYKSVKTAEKKKQNTQIKKKLLPIIQRVRKLIEQGDESVAQELVDDLSEEEYKIYTSLK